jgi:GGDEF domain-containing protein
VSTPPFPRPPRPVADVCAEDQGALAQELAKAWALALIAAQPLERSAGMPFAELCREAPVLCAQILRALGSDAELTALREGEHAALVARVGELAGAHELPSALAAAESLRSVIWRGLTGSLEHLDAHRVAELADRIAHIFLLITMALLTGPGERRSSETPSPVAAPEPVLGATQIEIHDARSEGPGAWIRSISAQLEQQSQSRAPFAVLLIEVIGIERLRHVEDPVILGRLVGEVQSSLRGELYGPDEITRESEGRYWLLAPGLDHTEATALAERIITRVRHTVSHRGAPVEVAVGIALYPQDGSEASELAASADTRLFAARAAGLSLAPRDAADSGPEFTL